MHRAGLGARLAYERRDGFGEAAGSLLRLRNGRERLALVYGDRARLTVAPLADGVAASVTLPYEPFRA